MLHRKVNILKSNSFFLFGARGTGKSTLIKKEFLGGNSIYINLLKFSELSRLQSDPDELERRIQANTDWVIIDEIQKAPALLDVVHGLIEKEDINVKFALTGSSARKLKAGGANLLAGRAFVYDLFPFTSCELGSDFDLFHALQWGLLPAIYNFTNDQEKKLYLEAYTNTYLKEEIWDEHLVNDLNPFRRFLPVAAQCNGTILNYSKVAKDVQVDTKTVQRYFQILEDTLICFMLEPFSLSVRKKQRKNPKCYFVDPGIIRGITGSFAMNITEHTLGFGYLFEHFLILEFLKRNSYLRKNYQFSFIRENNDKEIDLVIERPNDTNILIEIKSTNKLRKDQVSTLEYFSKKYPNYLCFCLSRDRVRQKFGKVQAFHWEEGLEACGLSFS